MAKRALISVLGIIFGLFAQDSLNYIITSGHFILQEDMGRDYLVAVLTSAILGFSILFWPISKIHKQDLILVWIIRSILALGLLVSFESSHPQDAYWYFYDAINGTAITRNPTTRDYPYLSLLPQGGHFFVVLLTKLLIIEGAKVGTRDRLGRTSLHWAAEKGNSAIANFLILNGAEINKSDNDGETALHEAAKWGHIKMVKLFIFHGADINAKGSDGRGPIHIAIASGNTNIMNLLKEHGASL